MGVQSVLHNMQENGLPIDLSNIKSAKWVSMEIRKQFLYSVRDALGWDMNKIRDMGFNALKLSYALKIYFGLFLTAEKAFAEAPNMWKKHYSSGNIYAKEFGRGHGVLVLENFDVDPLFCKYLEGYLEGIGAQTKSKNVVVRETKCTYRGDTNHEYTVTWEY